MVRKIIYDDRFEIEVPRSWGEEQWQAYMEAKAEYRYQGWIQDEKEKRERKERNRIIREKYEWEIKNGMIDED